MLIALNIHGKLERASVRAKEQRHDFRCPVCHQPVIFRSGKKTVPHFAHHKSQRCTVASEPESAAHLTGKLRLFEHLSMHTNACHLEKYFPEIKQKADIYFEWHNHCVAIEFQCSGIPLARLQERTNGYLSIRVTPIWIFHTKFLTRKSQTCTLLTNQIQASMQGTQPIFFFDADSDLCTILSQFSAFSSSQYFSNIDQVSLKSLSPHHLLSFQHKPPTYFHDWRMKRYFHLVRSIRFEGLRVPFYRDLYESGFHTASLPIFVGVPLPHGITLTTPTIEWQGRIFLALYLLKVITPIGIKCLFQQMIDDGKVSFRNSKQSSFLALAEYLQVLEQVGFIAFHNGLISIHHNSISCVNEEKLYQFLQKDIWI